MAALLLDFDGLILDTETATYQSWREEFVELGHEPIDLAAADDTPIGVEAAKAAGAFCIAVSAGMTAGLDYPHADLVVPSLADIEPGDVLGSR